MSGPAGQGYHTSAYCSNAPETIVYSIHHVGYTEDGVFLVQS